MSSYYYTHTNVDLLGVCMGKMTGLCVCRFSTEYFLGSKIETSLPYDLALGNKIRRKSCFPTLGVSSFTIK